MQSKVILIGGTSGAGKSTLARTVAAELGVSALSCDDLVQAAKAVTTSDTHPGLHVMSHTSHVEYYTASTLEQLTADARTQHEATWPAVERVIRCHATWGAPIVIEGWALIPEKVAALALDNVSSAWLTIDKDVLTARERAHVDFTRGSSDPERMFQNFLGRSLWYNDLIRSEAAAHEMRVLYQDGKQTPEKLAAHVLQ